MAPIDHSYGDFSVWSLGLISISLFVSIVVLLLNCGCLRKQEEKVKAGDDEGKKGAEDVKSGKGGKGKDGASESPKDKSKDKSKKSDSKSGGGKGGKGGSGDAEPKVAGKGTGKEAAADPKGAKKGGPKGKAEPKAAAGKEKAAPAAPGKAPAGKGKDAGAAKGAGAKAAPKAAAAAPKAASPKPLAVAKTIRGPAPSKDNVSVKSTGGDKSNTMQVGPEEAAEPEAVSLAGVLLETQADPAAAPSTKKKAADDSEMRMSRSVQPTLKPTMKKKDESTRFD